MSSNVFQFPFRSSGSVKTKQKDIKFFIRFGWRFDLLLSVAWRYTKLYRQFSFTCFYLAFLWIISPLSSHRLSPPRSTPHTQPWCRTCWHWSGRSPLCRAHRDQQRRQRPRWVDVQCRVGQPWADGTQLWRQSKGVFFILFYLKLTSEQQASFWPWEGAPSHTINCLCWWEASEGSHPCCSTTNFYLLVRRNGCNCMCCNNTNNTKCCTDTK